MKTVDALVQKLEQLNEAYRKGESLVSDGEYDELVDELRKIDSEHDYLQKVEPEKFDGKVEIKHPSPMLSTEKAYSSEDLTRFVTRVEKAAAVLGISDIKYRVTAKLDGLAGRDDGTVFVSRGNGITGYEISSAFRKGVIPEGGRGLGLGEIVMSKSYFEKNLAGEFEHPRNMVVGIVTSDVLNELSEKALGDKSVKFVPYATLADRIVAGDELVENIEEITIELLDDIDYPVDGLVADVVDKKIREYMGATAHHYRWQIAIKTKGDTAETIVESITWQVGRTGNVTPVMEITPIKLSGATIKRVTAHNAGNVRDKRIGEGAKIEIIRSGEVIPKLEKVIEEAEQIVLPANCPVCETELVWNNDFLKCINVKCDAKVVQSISHWFKTLGNADWFGVKTIEKLVKAGSNSLEKIYALKEQDYVDMEFGPVQSKNLFEAVGTSTTKSVEDWRFLAAFGISDLGKGDSRKLLTHFSLDKIVDLASDDIAAIHGFGDITSKSIPTGIENIKETFLFMMELDFNLEKTPLKSEVDSIENPISGKGIVFTGKMIRGSRDEMQNMARKLGANVQSAVSGKTDFLVCGEKVGAKKIEKAEKSGAKIITEEEFFNIVG